MNMNKNIWKSLHTINKEHGHLEDKNEITVIKSETPLDPSNRSIIIRSSICVMSPSPNVGHSIWFVYMVSSFNFWQIDQSSCIWSITSSHSVSTNLHLVREPERSIWLFHLVHLVHLVRWLYLLPGPSASSSIINPSIWSSRSSPTTYYYMVIYLVYLTVSIRQKAMWM